MLVVICGMHRSGSTLAWQVARMLLADQQGLRTPREVDPAEFIVAAERADDLLMAKVHYRSALELGYFPQTGARYLFTYRDLRDVVASLFRKGYLRVGDPGRGPGAARAIARREMRGEAVWRGMRDHWVGRYEDFAEDRAALVEQIAGYLGVVQTDEQRQRILAETDAPRQIERMLARVESGTISDEHRITGGHLTDGRAGTWRDTLTAAEVAAIEDVAGDWLREHGYDVA